MAVPKKSIIQENAERILATEPAAPVRVRLLRDVLAVPPEDVELTRARADLASSHWVAILAAEQRADGSWGRFHSANTRQKQRYPTTEVAVRRAVALGLTVEHALLRRASRYLRRFLVGDIPFPDPAEHNDRWATGTELFAASTLALIEPRAPILAPIRARWAQVVARAFGEAHNLDAEREAHRVLHGITSDLRYLALFDRYQLILLGSDPTALPGTVVHAALDWLWRRPEGIGYIGASLETSNPSTQRLDGWLHSHELLAAFGAPWQERASALLNWLWAQRDEDRLWDLGPRHTTSVSHCLPLSDHWRVRANRRADWSTRVLALLARASRANNREYRDQVALPHPGLPPTDTQERETRGTVP